MQVRVAKAQVLLFIQIQARSFLLIGMNVIELFVLVLTSHQISSFLRRLDDCWHTQHHAESLEERYQTVSYFSVLDTMLGAITDRFSKNPTSILGAFAVLHPESLSKADDDWHKGISDLGDFCRVDLDPTALQREFELF